MTFGKMMEYSSRITVDTGHFDIFIEGWAMVGSAKNGKEMVFYAETDEDIKLGKRKGNFYNNYLMIGQSGNIANEFAWYKIKAGQYLIVVYTDRRL